MHSPDRRGKHLDVPFLYLAEIARDSQLVRGAAGIFHLGAAPRPFMDGTTPVTLNGAIASPNYFKVLGMRSELGLFFVAEEGSRATAPIT